MLAFKIIVNGRPIAMIGQEDWAILGAQLLAHRDRLNGEDDMIDLAFHGLSKTNEKGFSEHFRWKSVRIEVGDEVEIAVVDVDAIDVPTKRYRSDAEAQESPFTDEEWREMRYKDYVELKKEFGGEGAA